MTLCVQMGGSVCLIDEKMHFLSSMMSELCKMAVCFDWIWLIELKTEYKSINIHATFDYKLTVASGNFALEAHLVQALAELVLQRLDGLAQLLGNRLTAQRLDVEVARGCGKDEKDDNCDVRAGRLEHVVESRERLDEHVGALVGELVASGGEQVERLVQVEVVVAVEVAAHEVVDLLLGESVQVLELVQGAELLDAEAVGRDDVGLALEQVLGLVARDARHGGEDVSAVSGRALHAVAVVDAAVAGLLVQVEVAQVVVEVAVAGAQVAAEQRGVRGEYGGHVQVTRATQHEANAGHPLVEVSEHELGLVAQLVQKLADEPGDEEAEDDGVIRLVVVERHADVAALPQLVLPLVEVVVGRLDVEQHHLRVAFDEPVAEHDVHALAAHRVDGRSQGAYLRLANLDLGAYGRLVERSHGQVVVAILQLRGGHLTADDRVDAADF